MRLLVIVLCVVALGAGMVGAKVGFDMPTTDLRTPDRVNVLFWFDDIDSGAPGWMHGDATATAVAHFHVDTYMAYVGHSWWCGNFDYDADGGYGNGWTDMLNIPATDVSSITYPILSFAFRYDSEPGYDFTYVQAQQGGVYVNLNLGYNGYAGWNDLGIYGFVLGAYDNPVMARYRFESDGAWSDEDFAAYGYQTVGGAFACDNVRIFDYYTSVVLFMDDVETGGLCVPSVPGSAGDWWHVTYDLCSSVSNPYSWWCGDDADTSLIPPGLNNWLQTPMVDISQAETCTLRMYIHAEVPTIDNDYWNNSVTFDGVEFYNLGSWWGDFGQCAGWGTAGIAGEVITDFLPQSQVAYRLTFHTTTNGCGPGTAGGAGVNLDDTWFEGTLTQSPVEESTWGGIKSMYR